MRLARNLTCLTGLALVLASCAGPPAVRDHGWRDAPHTQRPLNLPPLGAAGCPDAGGRRSSEPFQIALPGAVDPDRAPLPRTEAERHVFASCYETLVRIDGEGRLEPALARSWQAHDGGRSWVFQLRADARFWDGTPLGAVHVAEAWRRAERLCRLAGEPSPFLRFGPHGRAVEILGPRELAIHLAVAEDHLPYLLAHPALAVVGPYAEAGWPLGSGPVRPLAAPTAETLVLGPAVRHPLAPPWTSLTILLADDPDPRDRLDLGAAAVVTRQRTTIDYYAARAGSRVHPLPWDRTYYLLVPTEQTGALEADRRRWTSGWDPLELSREVVRQEAEPAGFFPLEPLAGTCSILPPEVDILDRPRLEPRSVRAARDADLILWPADDPDAGRLADRLAVLAARPLETLEDRPGIGPLTRPHPPQPGEAPEAVAVPAHELPAHVQAARAGAAVLPWPHRWPLACDELGRLLALAGWLVDAGLEPGPSIRAVPPDATPARYAEDREPPRALAVARRLERGLAVQPLVRSRAYLVARPDLVGPSCDHAGSLRLWTAGLRDDT